MEDPTGAGCAIPILFDPPIERKRPLHDTVIFRCPEIVGLSLTVAADAGNMTRSEYVRRAVVEQLRRDGYPFPEGDA